MGLFRGFDYFAFDYNYIQTFGRVGEYLYRFIENTLLFFRIVSYRHRTLASRGHRFFGIRCTQAFAEEVIIRVITSGEVPVLRKTNSNDCFLASSGIIRNRIRFPRTRSEVLLFSSESVPQIL